MTQPDPTPNDSRPVWELVVEDMHARDALSRAVLTLARRRAGLEQPKRRN